MANLGNKNGVYLARFRYVGREYKRSLKTTDARHAEAALLEVQRVIHCLTIGLLRVPDGVDPGDFIISGGTLTAAGQAAAPRAMPTLAAAEEFLGNLGHLAESSRSTIGVHLRNLRKVLKEKAGAPIDRVEQRDLERFLQSRLAVRSHTTVSKERDTVIQFFEWACAQGYLDGSPGRG